MLIKKGYFRQGLYNNAYLVIKNIRLVLLVMGCNSLFLDKLAAQPGTEWDSKSKWEWPTSAKVVSIISSIDSSTQQMYYSASSSPHKRPLVLSLHTWSGDYKQRDPVVNLCIQKDFNYIHPNFRGANNRPEAGGSKFAIQDIEDAIDWAIANLNVDTSNIHVIGVSGGAHATLLTYMKSKHRIKSFSAYVGIYNLIDWYHESKGRSNIYAEHIVAITSGNHGLPNFEEAYKRSPIFMNTPIALRAGSTLNLYSGIHDGYTGSVPITHTLNMFNKVVQDFDSKAKRSLVPDEHILTLLKRRKIYVDDEKPFPNFFGREVIYKKSFKDIVNLIIFDGGHEMPIGDVLMHIVGKQKL